MRLESIGAVETDGRMFLLSGKLYYNMTISMIHLYVNVHNTHFQFAR